MQGLRRAPGSWARDRVDQLSFGRVGEHLGIRDRTVVHGFPTKAELTSAVVAGAPEHRRTEAGATVALADGLLLFRQTAGPDAAQRTVERLGFA